MSHNQQQQNCCWGEVILLDGRSVEILIQPRLFAGDLFDTVASHFDLKEKEYFGLAFLDETGQYNWLNLEKRVLEHEYAQYTSNHIRQQSPTPFSIQSNQQSTKITNKNNNDNQQTQKHCSTLNEIKLTKFRLTKSKSRLPNVGKLKSLKKNKNLKHLTKTTTTTTTQPLSSMSSSINVDNKSRHSIPNHHYDHLINTNSSSMTTIKSSNSTNALSACISGSSFGSPNDTLSSPLPPPLPTMPPPPLPLVLNTPEMIVVNPSTIIKTNITSLMNDKNQNNNDDGVDDDNDDPLYDVINHQNNSNDNCDMINENKPNSQIFDHHHHHH